jgi:hypothetical protein
MSLVSVPLHAFGLVLLLLHPAPLSNTDIRPTRATSKARRRVMQAKRAPFVPCRRPSLCAERVPSEAAPFCGKALVPIVPHCAGL